MSLTRRGRHLGFCMAWNQVLDFVSKLDQKLERIPDYKLGAKEQPKHTSAWWAVAERDTTGKGRRSGEECQQWLEEGSGHSSHPAYGISCSVRKASVQGGCLLPQTTPVCAMQPEVSTLGSSPGGSQRSQMIDGLSKVISKHGPWRLPVSPSTSPNPRAPRGHWARRCPAMRTRWQLSAGGAPKAGPGNKQNEFMKFRRGVYRCYKHGTVHFSFHGFLFLCLPHS